MDIFLGLSSPLLLGDIKDDDTKKFLQTISRFCDELLIKARKFDGLANEYLKFTDEGGLAIKLIAGEALSRGMVLRASPTEDNTAIMVDANGDMPIGIAYSDAADGEFIWVVVSGIAYVLFKVGVTGTKGHIIHVSDTAGYAQDAATIPEVALHNREIGHVLETGSSGGLARSVLHFN